MYIWVYASNTYPLPNFLKNLVSALPYASASTYPLPFPCNIASYNPTNYSHYLRNSIYIKINENGVDGVIVNVETDT